MGKMTDLEVVTVRSTGRGSDYYGLCDQCGKVCSEHFVATRRKVWRRPDGQHYLGSGNGAFGHMDCLIQRYGTMTAENSLQRDGGTILLPQFAVDEAQEKIAGKAKTC